jgi:hypothetical protein
MNDIQQAIALLKAAGYRVTKPRVTERLALNAIGKPYGNYDPNYKIKHRVSTARLYKPYGYFLRGHLT